ncbi:MAG: hypothetical protein ACPGOY_02155 [Rhodospirillaceae bacterium]
MTDSPPTSEAMLTEALKPKTMRWIAAAAACWIVAPFSAPFFWSYILIEGVGLDGLVFVLFWTSFIGLPISAMGTLLLLVALVVFYDVLVNRPWWVWGCVGAAIGMLPVLLILLTDDDGFDYGLPSFLFLASGPVPGFVGTVVFRRVLLKPGKTAAADGAADHTR